MQNNLNISIPLDSGNDYEQATLYSAIDQEQLKMIRRQPSQSLLNKLFGNLNSLQIFTHVVVCLIVAILIASFVGCECPDVNTLINVSKQCPEIVMPQPCQKCQVCSKTTLDLNSQTRALKKMKEQEQKNNRKSQLKDTQTQTNKQGDYKMHPEKDSSFTNVNMQNCPQAHYPIDSKLFPMNLAYTLATREWQAQKQAELSNQTILIAKSYINVGFGQREWYLHAFQQNYTKTKYNFNQKITELPMCIISVNKNTLSSLAYAEYKFNIMSVKRQQYKNYKLIYIDDDPQSGNGKELEVSLRKYVKAIKFNQNKFLFIKNKRTHGLLYNLKRAAANYCQKESIVIPLEGSSAIVGQFTLKLLNNLFQSQLEPWQIYASSMTIHFGQIGEVKRLPKEIIQNNPYRTINENVFTSGQFNAFYREVLMKVPEDYLKDPNTAEYFGIGQRALLISLHELSRERAIYIPEILYLRQPLKENQREQQQKSKVNSVISRMKPLEKLKLLFADSTGSEILGKNLLTQTTKVMFTQVGNIDESLKSVQLFRDEVSYPETEVTPCIKPHFPSESKYYPIPSSYTNASWIPKMQEKAELSNQTVLLAKTYINIGTRQTNQQLINVEQAYYDKKYQISKYPKELPICLLIASYNNAHYQRYKFNLKSVLRQKYSNYQILYIDDASTDNTSSLVEQFIKQYNLPEGKFTLFKNDKSMGALYGQRKAALHGCKRQSISVILDGDDAMPGVYTLQLLNTLFQSRDAWYIYTNNMLTMYGQIGWCRRMPEEVTKTNSYRQYVKKRFITGHMRVFYTELFRMVPEEYLTDPQTHELFQVSCDRAAFVPMHELAQQRFIYVPEITYLYNSVTEYSVSQWGRPQQIKADVVLGKLRPLQKLQCLFFDVEGKCISSVDLINSLDRVTFKDQIPQKATFKYQDVRITRQGGEVQKLIQEIMNNEQKDQQKLQSGQVAQTIMPQKS